MALLLRAFLPLAWRRAPAPRATCRSPCDSQCLVPCPSPCMWAWTLTLGHSREKGVLSGPPGCCAANGDRRGSEGTIVVTSQDLYSFPLLALNSFL
jgi:hypothetical protein